MNAEDESRAADEIIPSALAGERLDRIVSMIADVSRSEAARLVDNGAVELNGTVSIVGKVRVVEGDRVRVDLDRVSRPTPPRPDDGVSVNVVHADQDLVVVDKDAGIVVHPGSGNENKTLVNGLLARFPEIASVGDPARPGIVHRLDSGTSGLMLVARSPRAHEVLSRMLANREVERVYTALVRGHLSAPSGVVDAPIGRSPRDPLKMAVVPNGRPARTHYLVLAEYRSPAELSLVECRLETGRTHQIRVHLAAIGNPVVGDRTYGGAQGAPHIERPMLHSSSLGLRHPVTDKHLTFSSPLPADFESVVAQCGESADDQV